MLNASTLNSVFGFVQQVDESSAFARARHAGRAAAILAEATK